jgi:hypothetical protein
VDRQEVPYEIGYGRPPRANRFAKGKSGNPKGRPKGSKNLSTVVLRESRQRVRINGSNGARTLSKLEAAVRQVSNKAAQGDLRASRDLFSLVQHSEAESSSGVSSEAMHEIDQRVLESLHKRIKAFHSEQPTQPAAIPEEGSK